jgi:Flp pilus assembly pilin Flp
VRPIHALIARLLSERGQTMSEYAVLIVWICLVVVVAATTLGHNLSSLLNSTASRV